MAHPPSLGYFGDSITAAGYSETSTYLGKGLQGYPTWTGILSNHRLLHNDAWNFGISGNTTTQMLARLSTVVAANLDVCVIHGGTNDLTNSVPFGTIISNLNSIYTTLLNTNTIIIAIPILGRTAPTALTGAQRQIGMQVNDWIRRQAQTRAGFFVADCSLDFDDPASTDWSHRAGYTGDGIHPSVVGAKVIGQKVADVISTFYPDWRQPVMSSVDLYDATLLPNGNMFDGMFAGTGGSIVGSAGNVATGWSGDSTQLGGATLVPSKTTLSDGRTAQQLVLSGTYTGSSKRAFMYRTLTNSNFAAGDTIEGLIYGEIGSNSGIAALDLDIEITDGGVTKRLHSSDMKADRLPAAGFSGNLLTPRYTFANTPTLVRVWLEVWFTNTGTTDAISGTVKWASASVRKVQ